MTTHSSQFLSLGSVRLHYLRSGGARPPLVLCHGMTDSAQCYGRLIAHLRERFDVVAYDARGHGRSSRVVAGAPSDAMVDDLEQLVASLRLERPVLMGHSMGAVTAALAALRRPGMARALLLEDPPLPLLQTPCVAQDAPLVEVPGWGDWRRAVLKRCTLGAAQIAELSGEEIGGWHPVDQQGWCDAQSSVDPRIFEARHPMLGPWYESLPELSCPLLLVAGERDRGSMVDSAQAERLVAAMPAAEFHRIPGAGHGVRRDRFDAFVARVDEFLQRCQASVST